MADSSAEKIVSGCLSLIYTSVENLGNRICALNYLSILIYKFFALLKK